MASIKKRFILTGFALVAARQPGVWPKNNRCAVIFYCSAIKNNLSQWPHPRRFRGNRAYGQKITAARLFFIAPQ
ncbi:hypothetical protein H8S23_05630 [Anaerofilum sp. BX8]|uniref:Uncharacterized protein n=1 Tax=Anaerofilum hominis TaxID=2763016 RepID=A0A923I8B9_9FIRM|nr:hypothetical protein [Anaerofilum hominis]MBC5580979.1 hypothetical protein [Anaerofilum hominis]